MSRDVAVVKPQNEQRAETEVEEFDRLYPPGSELRRQKELELAEKGIPVPGEGLVQSGADISNEELDEFRQWKANQDKVKVVEVEDEKASDAPVPAWRT
jgi:hypothetical protein